MYVSPAGAEIFSWAPLRAQQLALEAYQGAAGDLGMPNVARPMGGRIQCVLMPLTTIFLEEHQGHIGGMLREDRKIHAVAAAWGWPHGCRTACNAMLV